MSTRFGIFGVAVGVVVIAATLPHGACAALQGNDQTAAGYSQSPHPQTLSGGWDEENVRAVQMKLRQDGFYQGEIDGAYSSELAAALTRYQIRNGLPITGQLDSDTSKALDAKAAVASNTGTREQSSETWRRLRAGDKQFPGKTVWRAPSLSANETGTPPRSEPTATAPATQSAWTSPQRSPASGATIASESEKPESLPTTENKPASTPPATIAGSTANDINTERLRDYVGAFVLAGLDPNTGSETDFFADRVQYYNEGIKNREKIREDLKRYDSRWPGRKFWLAGDIKVEPQKGNRVRVTFPLRYELRNGAKRSSGKVDKTLVLEQTGNDLQIVAVIELKAKL